MQDRIENYVEVKILAVGASSFDERHNIVYDQEVRVKTATGEEFWLFDDYRLNASKEMIGKTKKIVVRTTNDWGSYEIQKAQNEAVGIKKVIKQPNRNNELLLVGEVKDLKDVGDQNKIFPHEIILDAGFGLIEVLIEADLELPKKIKKGDIIKVRTGRLDLDKVLED